MTDAERITALEHKVDARERDNKLLARDNKALARDVKRLEEKITELSSVEPPTLKGWRFKNLPNGVQEITPIQ